MAAGGGAMAGGVGGEAGGGDRASAARPSAASAIRPRFLPGDEKKSRQLSLTDSGSTR